MFLLVFTLYQCDCSGLAMATSCDLSCCRTSCSLTAELLADQAVSDMTRLGGSEPDIDRLAQAAENLNVYIHESQLSTPAQTGCLE